MPTMLVEIAASSWPPASGEVGFSVSAPDMLVPARLSWLSGRRGSLMFLRAAVSF
jgi:hypothetical protein